MHASPIHERTPGLNIMVKENKERDSSSSRRREPRVDVVIPLTVTWYDDKNQPHEVAGSTKVVNKYGCLLIVATMIPRETGITLFNPATQTSITARLVARGTTDTQGRQSVLLELENPFGVELDKPDPDFWGAQYVEARKTVFGEES
jgi:hypothetical protein